MIHVCFFLSTVYFRFLQKLNDKSYIYYDFIVFLRRARRILNNLIKNLGIK